MVCFALGNVLLDRGLMLLTYVFRFFFHNSIQMDYVIAICIKLCLRVHLKLQKMLNPSFIDS